jgi:histidinol-phosphate/aromatic aminotransferase/cobyric acid decarboxylase-like protein
MDVQRKYQRRSVDEIARERKELFESLNQVDAAEKGYSSGEIGEGRRK